MRSDKVEIILEFYLLWGGAAGRVQLVMYPQLCNVELYIFC